MLNQRIHPGMLLLLMFLCHFMEDHTVQAGNCWLRQARNGRCQVLYKTDLSKEECCKTGRLTTSWTEEDVNDNTLFKWMIFNGGAPNCIPCKETCENVDCGPGKKCKMNKKNKPRCVCAPDCSNITWKGPVCGLDGKTYRNECALLKARCKEQPELEVQYQGKCKKTCRDVLCPGSSTCVVDQTNNAYCVTCNRICPEPTSPEQYLCGNDGITYASACHLRKATCLLGRSIGLAYEGKCIKAKSCEDIQCSAGKKCLWDFKVGRGRCALCDELCPESKSDEAVCASDNTTYPSECAMKEAACSMGVLLEVKHSGSCNSENLETCLARKPACDVQLRRLLRGFMRRVHGELPGKWKCELNSFSLRKEPNPLFLPLVYFFGVFLVVLVWFGFASSLNAQVILDAV